MQLGRTFTIGVFLGIPVRLHWSFSLIIPFIAFQTYADGFDTANVFWFSVYILSIFLSVLLHEYGHALTARIFDVRTQDIIISPIGGVARLERFPERPLEEFLITLAGPSVNVVLAILLFMGLLCLGTYRILPVSNDISQIDNAVEFLRFACLTNVALFMFNLIPAFPMDGGRILRSLSSMVFERNRSTKIAAMVGRVIAIAFVIFGVYVGSVTLPLIGIFIFMSAGKELSMLNIEHNLGDTLNLDIMRSDYTKLHIGDTLRHAIEIYNLGSEKNFLVFDSLGYVSGALPELFILKATKEQVADQRVGQFLSKSVGRVRAQDSVLSTFHYMNKEGISIAEVVEGEEVVGVVDRSMVTQLVTRFSNHKK